MEPPLLYVCVLLFLLSFVLEEDEESAFLFLSFVVEYEPLLNPCEAPLLEEVFELESEEVLLLLLFEKLPDLNPSPLFELVASLVAADDDLLDEPELLKEPELNPLLDFELLELDLLLELEWLLLLLDFAKAMVLLDVFVFKKDIIFLHNTILITKVHFVVVD